MKKSPLYIKSGIGVPSQGSPIKIFSKLKKGKKIASKLYNYGKSYFTDTATKTTSKIVKPTTTKQITHKKTLSLPAPEKFVRHTDPKLSHNITKKIDLSKTHTGKGQRNLVWFGKEGTAGGYKYPGRQTFTANFSFKKPKHYSTNQVFKNEELQSLINKGYDIAIMGKGKGAHYMPINKAIIKNLKIKP
tara:strand:+ start:1264 stop:1830 length:567 start_codon:yes stop_codon:yes gene_type:complete